MKRMQNIIFICVFTLILAGSQALLFAGTTGKISGVVVDKVTGKPLFGTNIIMEGTSRGAASNAQGRFSILNVPPGVYTLRAMYIGYKPMRVENVRVNIDLTTTVNFELTESVIEAGEAVTIIAERKMVIKDLTATTAVLGADDIANLPVTEVSEAVELQAGLVKDAGGGLHVRGGRSGEVSYWIDGMPVTDVYDGGAVVDVNKDMVQELQVVSGAFNAEYGQAMSGIVNITTKEGNNDFGGSFTTYLGDHISAHNDVFMNVDAVDPLAIRNFEGSLHGALIKDKLFYFVNARNVYFDGWLDGQRRYAPNAVSSNLVVPKEFLEQYAPEYLKNAKEFDDGLYGIRYVLGSNDFIDSMAVPMIYDAATVANPDSFSVYYQKLKANHKDGKGDNKYVPMNWSRKQYYQAKLIYKMTPMVKWSYNVIVDNVKYKDFERDYLYAPDGTTDRFRRGMTQIAQLNHLLSERTFYNLGVSYFQKSFKRYAYEDQFDARYVHPYVGLQDPYSYKTGGTDHAWFERETNTLLAKFDITSMLTETHQVKLGIEYRRHRVNQEDITLRPIADQSDLNLAQSGPYIQTRVLDDSTIYHSQYAHNPAEFSAYLQDKMEFKNLIVNLGVRVDYFDPDAQVLNDESDPTINDPLRPENRYHDYGTDGLPNTHDPDGTEGNGVQDPGESNVTLAERQGYWYKDATAKWQVSPRLGVSFPITDRGVIHFSYGHFFQIPRFERLYQNPDFELGSGTGNVGVIGNANLEPEQTINGEIGLQQQMTDDISLNVTAYFRDIRNLTGTRSDQILLFGESATYSKFTNSDFGFIRGFILALNKRFSNSFAASLDYTFQIAKGTNSDPEAARNALAGGAQPEVQMVSLNWDQTHTVNASFTYGGKDWGCSLIGQWGTGLPYSPRATVDITTLLVNSQRKPGFYNVDLRAYKDIALPYGSITVFARVFNLFDSLSELNVFSDTGRAGFTRDQDIAEATNPPEIVNSLQQWFTIPTHYAEPRRIEVGMTYRF